MTLRQIIQRVVLECLNLHGGNVSATARELGVGRRTVQRWMTGIGEAA